MPLDSSTAETTKKPGLWALIKEDVACVFERDPAARNTFEVLTTYPGVHAIISYRLANGLWRSGWKYAARLLSFLARGFTTIEIHPGATIGRRFFIDHGAGVVIGETAEVGDDVTLYHGVTLGGTSWSKGKRHPTLEDGVVVGGGAKILGPITVGREAKVGANSVVIENVPAERTVVGIPGRVVKSSRPANSNPFGVDLNHHFIPDPVADALSCLIDRVQELERELKVQRFDGLEPGCADCETSPVCDRNESQDGPVLGERF
ncbi:MAG: serine O-acetyltransferase [Magnetovibrionaceae bacterium]